MSPKQKKLILIISLVFFIALLFQSYFIYALYQTKQKSEVVLSSDTSSTNFNSTLFHLAPLPSEMDFCGEKVPMNDPEVHERLQTEWIAATNRQLATWTILSRSTRYFPIIEAILKENNVPDDFKYLAVAESYLANAVSPSKAEGFWQFLKETGIAYGLEITKTIDERYDVAKATYAACKYLKSAYKKFGNWTLAAATYNMGQGGLSRQMEKQSQNDYYRLRLNPETGKYIFRILTLKYVLMDPQAMGLDWSPELGQKKPSTRSIEVTESINDLVEWSVQNGTDYRMVRYLNPWIRADHLDVLPGKTYTILLPTE